MSQNDDFVLIHKGNKTAKWRYLEFKNLFLRKQHFLLWSESNDTRKKVKISVCVDQRWKFHSLPFCFVPLVHLHCTACCMSCPRVFKKRKTKSMATNNIQKQKYWSVTVGPVSLRPREWAMNQKPNERKAAGHQELFHLKSLLKARFDFFSYMNAVFMQKEVLPGWLNLFISKIWRINTDQTGCLFALNKLFTLQSFSMQRSDHRSLQSMLLVF